MMNPTKKSWLSAALVFGITCLLAEHVMAQTVRINAESRSTTRRGEANFVAIATLRNGVLSTENTNGAGTVSGQPTGGTPTMATTSAAMTGTSLDATPVPSSAASQMSVDLTTATMRASVVNTPVTAGEGEGSTTTGQLRDLLYFQNNTGGAITLPFTMRVDGVLSAVPPGSRSNGWQAAANLSLSPPLPTSLPVPTLRGGTALRQSIGYFYRESSRTGGRDFTGPGGVVMPVGPGPIWTTALVGSEGGGSLQSELILPPGLSAATIELDFSVRGSSGVNLDFGRTGEGLRFAFGDLPAGLTMTSESGAFLGAPRPPSTGPTGLSVVSVIGNRATFRWTAPVGVSPTGYVLEGGVAPGQVLGSLPTGSTATTFSVDLPTGVFFVRIHALTPAGRSTPTNETQVFVNVPQAPASPQRLLGLVNGSALGLSWMNATSGGAPSAIRVDVTGGVNTSLSLPVGESFTFPSVPPGTYTFRVASVNAVGASAQSSPVSLTFPGGCSGVPQAPSAPSITRTGARLDLTWEPPASGPAVASFVLEVSGALSLSAPVNQRAIGGVVPAGSYTFRVRAANACGTSADSPPASVTVP